MQIQTLKLLQLPGGLGHYLNLKKKKEYLCHVPKICARIWQTAPSIKLHFLTMIRFSVHDLKVLLWICCLGDEVKLTDDKATSALLLKCYPKVYNQGWVHEC